MFNDSRVLVPRNMHKTKDETFLFTYRAFHIKFLRFILNLYDHHYGLWQYGTTLLCTILFHKDMATFSLEMIKRDKMSSSIEF